MFIQITFPQNKIKETHGNKQHNSNNNNKNIDNTVWFISGLHYYV